MIGSDWAGTVKSGWTVETFALLMALSGEKPV
jgi:hypothetical protein